MPHKIFNLYGILAATLISLARRYS